MIVASLDTTASDTIFSTHTTERQDNAQYNLCAVLLGESVCAVRYFLLIVHRTFVLVLNELRIINSLNKRTANKYVQLYVVVTIPRQAFKVWDMSSCKSQSNCAVIINRSLGILVCDIRGYIVHTPFMLVL